MGKQDDDYQSFTGAKPSRAMFPAVWPFSSAPKSAAVGTGRGELVTVCLCFKNRGRYH